jgi:hypothetical protein
MNVTTKVLWSPVHSDQFLSYCSTKLNLYNVIKYEEKAGNHGHQGLTSIFYHTSHIFLFKYNLTSAWHKYIWGHRGRDRMVIGFTTTYMQSVCLKPVHDKMYFDTTLCDKVCRWLPTDLWFSLDTPPIKPTSTI